jgi:CheY-like chemotaxis protein
MSGAATLLLIDDEPLVHEIVEPVLSEAGFAVACAVRAEQALVLLRARGSDFCAIVTDIDLGPGLSGWDVARLARQIVADIPVVYATGGRVHEFPAKAVPGAVLVTKPYQPDKVLEALTSVLPKATC